jgi:P27 family predicted phage terminase small subunit
MTEISPKPPSWLSKEAKVHWDRVAIMAARNNTLSENYFYTFGLLCESMADLVYLQTIIRKEGLTIPGADGNVKAHPALRQLESCRAHVLKMLESFGLSAKSKKHVKEETPNYFGIRFGKPPRKKNDGKTR